MFITICAALTAFLAGLCLANYQRTKQFVENSPYDTGSDNFERVRQVKRHAVSNVLIAIGVNAFNFYVIYFT